VFNVVSLAGAECSALEDVEASIPKRLLNTLYTWIAVHHSLSVFTYADFLNLFYVLSY
jgi:hypothetical protein